MFGHRNTGKIEDGLEFGTWSWLPAVCLLILRFLERHSWRCIHRFSTVQRRFVISIVVVAWATSSAWIIGWVFAGIDATLFGGQSPAFLDEQCGKPNKITHPDRGLLLGIPLNWPPNGWLTDWYMIGFPTTFGSASVPATAPGSSRPGARRRGAPDLEQPQRATLRRPKWGFYHENCGSNYNGWKLGSCWNLLNVAKI